MQQAVILSPPPLPPSPPIHFKNMQNVNINQAMVYSWTPTLGANYHAATQNTFQSVVPHGSSTTERDQLKRLLNAKTLSFVHLLLAGMSKPLRKRMLNLI